MRSNTTPVVVLMIRIFVFVLPFLCVSAVISPFVEKIPCTTSARQLYSVLADLPPPEEWIPYVPSDQQTEIDTWSSNGISHATAVITFSHAGYRVADWGSVERIGSTFFVDSKIEMWTGPSPLVMTTRSYSYSLGPLRPGSYEFIFKSRGEVVKRIPFNMGACIIETNSILFKPGDDFTLAIRLKENIEQPFDLYIMMVAFSKIHSIYLNGTLEPGIKPVATQVRGYRAPYSKTILRHVTVPPHLAPWETVTFYLAVVETGTRPPVASLPELSPDTPHVIMFDKQTVVIRATF